MLDALLALAALLQAAAPAEVQAAPPAQAEDPLAPARAGKLRCVSPNAAKRNCLSIIRFHVLPDGNFDATVSGFLERPQVLVVYRTSGRVDGNAVCSLVRTSELSAGEIFVNAKRATPTQASAIERRLLARMSEVNGKRRCFIDQPEGSGIVSNITLNGIVQPGMRQRVAWIDPSDGYAIGE